jgi:hypothetical protein
MINFARTNLTLASILAAGLISTTFGSVPVPGGAQTRGLGVAFPFTFHGGDKTSKKTARDSADEVLRRAGFATVPNDVARSAWQGPKDRFRDRPSDDALEAYGTRLHASVVLFGDVDWNTRSIWVNLGPKTISTAKVDVYVFDVAAHKIVYKQEGTEGRSDEPENGWKIAADVLITPLVTAVSGGPATPREQRAAQIALGKALHPWVRGNR